MNVININIITFITCKYQTKEIWEETLKIPAQNNFGNQKAQIKICNIQ
jgi:hypothetical protein